MVDSGDDLFVVPSLKHEGPHGSGNPAPPLRGRGGAGGAVSACPPPVAPQADPTSWPACGYRSSTFNAGRGEIPEALGGPWRPMEPRSPLARGLGTQPRGAGSRPLQAAGPGFPDSHPADKVLRALELGLDRADELLERWLGHHEFDLPLDLPAG